MEFNNKHGFSILFEYFKGEHDFNKWLTQFEEQFKLHEFEEPQKFSMLKLLCAKDVNVYNAWKNEVIPDYDALVDILKLIFVEDVEDDWQIVAKFYSFYCSGTTQDFTNKFLAYYNQHNILKSMNDAVVLCLYHSKLRLPTEFKQFLASKFANVFECKVASSSSSSSSSKQTKTSYMVDDKELSGVSQLVSYMHRLLNTNYNKYVCRKCNKLHSGKCKNINKDDSPSCYFMPSSNKLILDSGSNKYSLISSTLVKDKSLINIDSSNVIRVLKNKIELDKYVNIQINFNNKQTLHKFYIVDDDFGIIIGEELRKKLLLPTDRLYNCNLIYYTDMINLQLMQLSDDFIIQNEHDLSIIIRETKYYNDKLDLKQDIINKFTNSKINTEVTYNEKQIEVDIKIDYNKLNEKYKARKQIISRALDEQEKIKEIRRLISLGLIEKCNNSKYTTNCFFTKKNGKPRLVFDYKNLNDFVEHVRESIPNGQSIVNRISEYKIFCKLDIRQAFHNLRLNEELRNLTAFHTPLGVYRWKVLPFGLKSASLLFQNAMNTIFPEDWIIQYIDDLLICGTDYQDLYNKLNDILARLEKYNLKININKCEFFINKFDFLGLTFTNNTYFPSNDKIQKMKDMQFPDSMKKLRSLLGFTNYFAKYIQNYSMIIKPLQSLLTGSKTNESFKNKINDTAIESFRQIKNEIINRNNNLYIPDFQQPFNIYSDASEDGISAIITQNGYIVEAFSKSLSKAQENYTINKLELFAVFKAVQKFKYYLNNATTIIYTDHEALISMIKNKKSFDSRIEARWITSIRENIFDIKFVDGKHNMSDYFSRYCFALLNDDKNDNLSEEKLIYHQRKQFKNLFNLLDQEDETINKKYTTINNILYIKDLYHKRLRIVIPDKLITDLVNEYHDNNNHCSYDKCYSTMRRYYYFKDMRDKIKDFVTSCIECQRNNRDTTKKI